VKAQTVRIKTAHSLVETHERSALVLALLVTLVATLWAAAARAEPTARFEDVATQEARTVAAPAAGNAAAPGARSWATRGAEAWTERARRLVARKAYGEAAQAYTEALRLDATYGPAWLELARLRGVTGDAREAERLYDRAVRLPDVAVQALADRASLRRSLRRDTEALRDLAAAVDLAPTDQELAERLAAWYIEKRAWPAALAVWRRLAASLEASGDAESQRRARIQVRALSLLAAETDPVGSGHNHSSWVRRALAQTGSRKP
jgi:tetratricopeptide (TPR) repeat protein